MTWPAYRDRTRDRVLRAALAVVERREGALPELEHALAAYRVADAAGFRRATEPGLHGRDRRVLVTEAMIRELCAMEPIVVHGWAVHAYSEGEDGHRDRGEVDPLRERPGNAIRSDSGQRDKHGPS